MNALLNVLDRSWRRLDGLARGAAFPIFMLATLASMTLVVVGLFLLPASQTGLGAFAEQFRAWCLSADPSGRVPVASLASMVLGPVMLAGVVVLVWAEPLREALGRGPRAWSAPALAGVMACAVATAGLPRPGGPSGEPLVFPSEALRTAVPAPDFSLVDHREREVSLAALEGRVVLLTSMYATCPQSCPLIMAQAQRVVAALDAATRSELTVVAVTMDPAHDTPAVLDELARGRRLDPATWRLATGPEDEVNRLLDRMDVSRSHDPSSGLIDHANVFMLVDREGRIAYRFTLGELQERWMVEAIELLVDEPLPES